MLEMFVVRETVFFLTGVMIGIGAIARLITGISLKKLVRAASNMSKSNHPLMRLVRAKFEHGCMVSDKVQNVGAFVEKYLYEYRVLGVRLHTWRQWAKGSIWLCLIFGATGTALAYAAGEREQGLYRYGILGGMGALALFLLRMLADDAYQLEAEIAREEKVPPYIVFSDKTLVQMCIEKPTNKNAMLKVSGVGEFKFEKYGERFLEVIRSWT